MSEFLRLYIGEIILLLVWVMAVLACFIAWIDEREERIKRIWMKNYGKGNFNANS